MILIKIMLFHFNLYSWIYEIINTDLYIKEPYDASFNHIGLCWIYITRIMVCWPSLVGQTEVPSTTVKKTLYT